MARIGSGTPYGLAPIAVPLASGAVFYPPSGQYLVTTGASTDVEWWDQAYQLWRVLIAVSSAGVFSADGINIRLRNITGAITVASITAGSGYTNGIGQAATGTTLSVSAPGTNGEQATMFPIVGGTVSTATITAGGSGLVTAPLLVCSPPPPGGVTAQFTCAINRTTGAITSVTNVVAGAGYIAVPSITVIPQLGGYAGSLPPSPATQAAFGSSTGTNYVWPPWQMNNIGAFTTLPVITAGALSGSGTLTGAVVIDAGSLYTGTPTVTVTGPGSSGAVTLNAVTAAANDQSYLQPITF